MAFQGNGPSRGRAEEQQGTGHGEGAPRASWMRVPRAPGNKAQVLTQSKGGAPDPDMAGVGASPGEARLEASGVGGLGTEQGCQAAYVRNSGVGNKVGIPGQDRNPLGFWHIKAEEQ